MFVFFLILGFWQNPLDTSPEHIADLARKTQLLQAADDGHLDQVKSLVEAGVPLETTNRFGMTPLFLSARRGHIDVVKFLHAKGASLETKEYVYETDVFSAVLYSDADTGDVVRFLVGQKLVPKPSDWGNLLEKNKVDLVKILFEEGVPVPDRQLIANGAAGTGKTDMVKVLLAQGEWTPAQKEQILDVALLAGQSEVVSFLAVTPALRQRKKPRLPEPTDLLGTYATERGYMVTFSYDDGLFAVMGSDEDKPNPIYRHSDGRFYAANRYGAFFVFEPAEGRAEKVTLHFPDDNFTVTRANAEKHQKADTPAAEPSADANVKPNAASAQPESVATGGESSASSHAQWPAFRGNGARGLAEGQNLPSVWSETENVRWKKRIPGLAHAAPIVWGDTLFVVTAENGEAEPTLRIGLFGDIESIGDLNEQTWSIMAYDVQTGAQKWRKVASTGKPKNDRHSKSTHANSTPVTDGKHLVVLLGSEGLFCFDLSGRLMWRKALGLLEGSWFYDEKVHWGHGSSPVIDGDRVYLQVDRARNAFVAAYALADGKELWKTDRNEIPSWSTPTVVHHKGGSELITNGTNAIRGYDAKTGSLLWWLDGNSEIAVPTPFEHQGRIVVTNGYRPIQPIYVFLPGARGDITLKKDSDQNDPHVVWHTERGGPYLPTPVAYNGLLYVVDNRGTLSCYDIATGERHYRQRMDRGLAVTASPLVVDGKLLVFCEYGETYVIQTGTTYQRLGVNKIDDHLLATPAVAAGMLFLRGEDHLYAIGRAKTASQAE